MTNFRNLLAALLVVSALAVGVPASADSAPANAPSAVKLKNLGCC